MEQPHFRVDVEDHDALVVLRLHGELDLMSVPTVEETVERHGGAKPLVIDLRDLDFMDSSGLRLILELRSRYGDRDVGFMAPTPRVARVLDMTGVRAKLTWVDEPRELLG
jgi:anti-sigma B factor antagonist